MTTIQEQTDEDDWPVGFLGMTPNDVQPSAYETPKKKIGLGKLINDEDSDGIWSGILSGI